MCVCRNCVCLLKSQVVCNVIEVLAFCRANCANTSTFEKMKYYGKYYKYVKYYVKVCKCRVSQFTNWFHSSVVIVNYT